MLTVVNIYRMCFMISVVGYQTEGLYFYLQRP